MNENSIYVTTQTKIEKVIQGCLAHQNEEFPFYICNVNDLIYKHKLWKKLFPRIEPHYAVKCNNNQIVLQILAALGLNFDCASKREIHQILSIGIDPSRIIYAHTCKLASHIRYAAEKNVDLMTFDSKEELYKIKANFPSARTVLRIKYDDPLAIGAFGNKFGCDPYTEAEKLLLIALELNINVVGVSFHIGYGSKNAAIFYEAIKAARHVFNISEKLRCTLYLLDIGGGYPGKHDDLILTYAKNVNKALEDFFPDESVKVISEPGTYFVESAFTLACCIQSAKENCSSGLSPFYHYYLNDGVFGNLSGIISYNLEIVPRPVQPKMNEKLYHSTVWGPTCDKIDKICDKVLLPKLNVGDWLIFDDIGNYSSVLTTSFNGFGTSMTYSIINPENMLFLKNTCLFSNYNFLVEIPNVDVTENIDSDGYLLA